MMHAIEHQEIVHPPSPDLHDPARFDFNDRGPQSEHPPEIPDVEAPEEE